MGFKIQHNIKQENTPAHILGVNFSIATFDKTVLTVFEHNNDNFKIVNTTKYHNRTLLIDIKKIIEKCKRYNIKKVYVEQNQYQMITNKAIKNELAFLDIEMEIVNSSSDKKYWKIIQNKN